MSQSRALSWTPNKSDVEKIKKEIKLSYKDGRKSDLLNPRPPLSIKDDGRDPAIMPSEDFIEDCAKIGTFLLDNNEFIRQLKKLNALILIKKCKTHKTKPTIKRLLRETLEKELEKFGFHPQFGKAFDAIDPVGFRAAIANGLLLKDVALGRDIHGEFTHAIQWLMIAWQQADTHFLKSPVIEIFKRMGSEESVFKRAPISARKPNRPRKEMGLWDLIIDRPYSRYEPASILKDFRNPDDITLLLQYNKTKSLQLLAELMQARRKKRLKAPSDGRDMKHKYNNPHGFYHKSTILGIHEPEGCKISLEKFKRSERKKQ